MRELETPSNSPGESPFAPSPLPRLSILHLMLWTFWSAVLLALLRVALILDADLPPEDAPMHRVFSVVTGVINGAVLAGATILVLARLRGNRPMLRHPGHWLLFVTAIYSAIFMPGIVLLRLFRASEGGAMVFLSFPVTCLFAAIAYLLAARPRDRISWRITFVVLSGFNLLWCLTYLGFGLIIDRSGSWFRFLFMAVTWGDVLLPVGVLFVSILDLTHNRRQDWLHWTGVGTYLANGCLKLAVMIGHWSIWR